MDDLDRRFDEADLKWHRLMLKDAVALLLAIRYDDPYQGVHGWFEEIDDFLESAR